MSQPFSDASLFEDFSFVGMPMLAMRDSVPPQRVPEAKVMSFPEAEPMRRKLDPDLPGALFS